MKDIPELSTSRLRLRGPVAEDFESIAALWGDTSVVAMISGVPDAPGEAWGRLLRHIGHWAVMDYGFWTVEDRVTGEFLGQAGFFDHMRGIAAALNGMPEAGWAFVPNAHGKGVATEAMRAAHDWGDRFLPGRGTYALFNPAHGASIRVADKLGYGPGKPYPWKESHALVMTRPRP